MPNPPARPAALTETPTPDPTPEPTDTIKEAPSPVRVTGWLPPYLTTEQVTVLLKDIAPHRVAHVQGNSNVEAWDIRAHLNRVFGFARWSDESLGTVLLYETETERDGKARWTVAYRAHRRLTIKAPDGTVLAFYDGSAVGESVNQPVRGDAHDGSIKTAESQALKRCATNLGTGYGLSLYNDGSLRDVVRMTLVGNPPAE